MVLLKLLLYVLIMLEIAAAEPATESSEVVALGKIIDHWNLQKKINTSIDPCNQTAIWAVENANPRIACECSTSVCHITHLKIYSLDISGELPQELFFLKELMDLDLGQNVLNGSIPPQIGQLSKMQYLSFGINNFTGPLPVELGNLTQLISLSFSSNNFQGVLPSELGKLTSLQQLYIDSSGLSGPIPTELLSLTSLHTWWASDNRFTGKLPEFIGSFTDLKVLRLEGTDLEGPIPSSYSKLTKLQDLRIGDLASGDSSPDFLENLTSLSILSLRNCRIIGQLPESLSTFTNLKFLDLSFNKFNGQIPTSFQNFTALQYLYLGSNSLSGELPLNLATSNLLALDVSFNPLSGTLPMGAPSMSMNILGTSISDNASQNRKVSQELGCFTANRTCKNKGRSTSFSANCGGTEEMSAIDIRFDADTETLGAASLYVQSDNQWAVSNSGVFISNPNGPQDIVETDSQITDTLDSELYKNARKSAGSLHYYGLGLKNGMYKIQIHFSEIQIEDTVSWKGLGKRLFDVFIQGERVVRDFDIRKEAGGSKRAMIKTFEANVSNTNLDIHFYWAGRGTCCIPFQSTYGPLVSAIHVVQEKSVDSSRSIRKRVGRIIGITVGCVAAGLVIMGSIFYFWWRKKAPKVLWIHPHPSRK